MTTSKDNNEHTPRMKNTTSNEVMECNNAKKPTDDSSITLVTYKKKPHATPRVYTGSLSRTSDPNSHEVTLLHFKQFHK